MKTIREFKFSQFLCGFNVEYAVSHCKLLVFLLATLSYSLSNVEGKAKPNCQACKDIVSNFHKGLASTAKSNFGGGNTKWEEKSLGSYATSEVRLVEIMEHLCDEAAKECHSLLEEHEELLERYWFKEFAQKKDTDLFKYFCIENMKACCPNNTFGPNCSPCLGGVDRPCNGQGRCQGEGTREGDGKCSCNAGYQGDLCNECRDGYFEETKNESQTVCKVCHIACKNTCWEGGPKGCDECKDGWLVDEEQGCIDVNECLTDPCEENQFCTNTQGSYTCFSCDVACSSCSGSGADQCNECSSGYTLNQETNICQDNNECELDTSVCQGEHLICKNTPGSYECECESGYYMKDKESKECLIIPKESKSTQKTASPHSASEHIKKKFSKRKDLDWAKFKDAPSITGHFLVMAFYGISCRVASSNRLVVIALTLLMIIHVVWFATNSR